MFSRFAAIASNTFIETIRQPIYSILLWIAVGLLIVNPSIALFSLQSGLDNKIMQDVGLSTMLLFGLLASAFSATGVITREIENRTVLTVICKPVSRTNFILAKYFGVCGALLIGCYLLCIVFFFTLRHGTMETVSDKFDQPVLVFGLGAISISLIAATFGNFTYGWHFPAALIAWIVPLGSAALLAVLCFGPQWQLQSPSKDFGNMQIIYATLLMFCAVVIMTAFAVVLSTRFSQVLTLVLCVGVLMVGLLSDYWIGQRLEKEPSAAYQALYTLLPNFQFFWVADALTQGITIELQHVLRVVGYTLLYIPAVLCAGVAMFQTREVG